MRNDDSLYVRQLEAALATQSSVRLGLWGITPELSGADKRPLK